MAKDIQIKLHHYLTMKSRSQNKNAGKEETTNADLVNFVKDRIRLHYGDRPVYIVNEARLRDSLDRYPDFCSVGWFISADGSRELVVVDHGSSFESARKSLFYSVSSVDWNGLSGDTRKP